jgi:hypothetical protein
MDPVLGLQHALYHREDAEALEVVAIQPADPSVLVSDLDDLFVPDLRHRRRRSSAAAAAVSVTSS